MIKVQTLRLRGFCASSLLVASSLLALAACAGTPTDSEAHTVFVPHGVVKPLTRQAAGIPLTDSTPSPVVRKPVVRKPDVRKPDVRKPVVRKPVSIAKPSPGRAAVEVVPSKPDTSFPETTRGLSPQDPQGRADIVKKAIENARRSLQMRLFEDARNEAAFALELDSDNAEARDILSRCRQILGEETVPLDNSFESQLISHRVAQERERALVNNDLALGRAEMDLGRYGRAIDRFERAATIINFSQFVQRNDPLRTETNLLLNGARKAKREADTSALQGLKEASEAELARIARNREIAREQSVERLLETANVMFQNGEYEQSVALVDQALRIDPINPTASGLRDLADRARHNATMDFNRERFRTEWNKTFNELKHSAVPQTDIVVFDPSRWAMVNRRRPASYTQATELDTPANQAITKLLENTVLEHNFASATVQDWANYYAQVTGATFFVSQEVKDLDAETTTLSEFRLPRRSVASALSAIESQTGVAYKITDGLVQLVTPENAIGKLMLQPFNVTELITAVQGKPGPDLRLKVPGDDEPLFPEVEEDATPSVVDPDRLMELVTSTIAEDKWDGAPFTINHQQGVIYVRADRDTLDQVEDLINELRRHVGIQIDIEARFLSVEDSFLEDVGIDLRGLGNQSAQGLAGRGLEKKGDRSNAGFDDFGPRQGQNAAVPGNVGTGTEPGIFFNDGEDGDAMARIENLFNSTLGGRNGGMTNAGGFSLQYAFLDDTEVEIVLRAVSKQERSEQIEAPRLLVYNNTRASMHFLRNISYIRDFEVEIAQAVAVANPVIGTVHDGVSLDVRPVVDSDLKFITMELRPTVMTLQLPIPTFTTTLGVGQPISIQLPEVTLQRVRTTVTMPDGGTMMLGGMRLVERQNLRSTVPLLGSIPGLSWLFSRNGTSVQNRKMLILIRAKIVLMEEHEPDPATLPIDDMISMR